MKLYFLILALLIGCDSSQRTRAPDAWVNSSSLTDNGTYPPIGNTTIPPNTTPTTPTTTAGFENCGTTQYHTIDIGYFKLCQSSLDETSFRFQPSLTSSAVRICLIPTYKDASGSSTYIGQPQCTYTSANQTINGKLFKDRSGFTTYPINGVIVMKETLLTEYIGCMHGYGNWPGNACASASANAYCNYWVPRCPYGSRSGTACDGEARNYMAQTCSAFKSKYANSYLDISTR